MGLQLVIQDIEYRAKVNPEILGVAVLSIISEATNTSVASAFSKSTKHTRRGKFKYFEYEDILRVAANPVDTIGKF